MTRGIVAKKNLNHGTRTDADCAYRGQLAYRSGPYKIIYGHPFSYPTDSSCANWITCGNGWVQAPDLGPPTPPNSKNPSPDQPEDADAYTWGGVWLFDIEADPREENDLSEVMPDKVNELLAKLLAINATQIDQDAHHDGSAVDTEEIHIDDTTTIKCRVPWMDHLSPTTDCGEGRASCCPAKVLIV